MAKYELKTKLNDGDVDKFIDSVKNEKRREDAKKLLKIFKEETGLSPKMWGSIIGYGTYHYKYASGREGDWMLTGFSPRVQNLSLYIVSGFDEYAKESGFDPAPFLKKLGKHKVSKACLYINKLEDVDEKILRKIISGSVKVLEGNSC